MLKRIIKGHSSQMASVGGGMGREKSNKATTQSPPPALHDECKISMRLLLLFCSLTLLTFAEMHSAFHSGNL